MLRGAVVCMTSVTRRISVGSQVTGMRSLLKESCCYIVTIAAIGTGRISPDWCRIGTLGKCIEASTVTVNVTTNSVRGIVPRR